MMNLGPLLAALLMSTSGDSIFAREQVGGATLHIEIRQPVDQQKAAELIEWVRASANNVELAYGRFPNPAAKIVVIPSANNSWGSNSSVIFGRVTRSKGETVELFVNPERPIEEYYESWVATHEFSHLMLPLLHERHRWISEGFASYYQNVLMSRAGHYSAETAWSELSAGFERGQASRPELSPNEAGRAGMRSARMKIYWSGAAIALLADVELRKRSDGAESLDTVLGKLQSCCLPSRRQWSGPRLFERLDSFVDEPVFMPLYRKYANERGFPDLQPVLADLGVLQDGNDVTLSEDAPLSNIRRAIE